MQILTMNKIDPAGLEVLEQQGFQVGDAMDAPEGLLLRSAKIHDMDFPASLLAVAREGVDLGAMRGLGWEYTLD